MNTLHFKYALEVERVGSISQAAENLFMAQPNLSKAIKELEESLAITIFQRTSKGMVPTEQGLEFLKYAKKILIQLENMEAIYIPKEERMSRQCLRVSIPRGSYISYGFTKFVKELDLKKEIDVHLQETSSLQTIANVAENSFDLGIIRYQNIYETYFLDYLKEKDLDYKIIWEFECLVVMSKEHPLANREIIDYHELMETSIEIVHGDNTIPYLPVSEIKRPEVEEMGSKQKRIYIFERGSQFDMLANVPTTYMWVSPIPEELCQRNQLVQRRCVISNNNFKDVLIYQNGYHQSKVEQRFIEKIFEEKQIVAATTYR